MGFGFNFKDYNDRLTFKKPILKEVKQTLDEQDFAKAEIAKEKKQKLKKFKEKNSKNFWNLGKWGGVTTTPISSIINNQKNILKSSEKINQFSW